MLLLEGFHLHAAGARSLLRRRGSTAVKLVDGALLAAHIIGYLGGLNYQIEHHLFPSMPRPSLRHAREPVRAFCAQHGIAYCDSGFFACYAEILRHLHTVGSLRPQLDY